MKLGWHEDGVHEAIVQHGEKWIPGLQTNSSPNQQQDVCANNPVRVFFPLCGKSLDMAHLTQVSAVSQVVGVDGIRGALETFAKEHPSLAIRDDIKEESSSSHERLLGNKILLLKGDFFELNEQVTEGRFEAIFDRASLVAITPTLREDYVQVIGKLIQPGGKILLVVIERISGTDEDIMSGPPYSVAESEVRRLYEGQEWVQSVTLLEAQGEQARNDGRSMRSLFFLVQAKKIGRLSEDRQENRSMQNSARIV